MITILCERYRIKAEEDKDMIIEVIRIKCLLESKEDFTQNKFIKDIIRDADNNIVFLVYRVNN